VRHRWCCVGFPLVAGQSRDAAAPPSDANDPPPHLPVKAKRVIQITACGGVSQIDSFDYKPDLEKYHGKPLGGDERPDVFFGKVGLLRKNELGVQAAWRKRPVGFRVVSASRRAG